MRHFNLLIGISKEKERERQRERERERFEQKRDDIH